MDGITLRLKIEMPEHPENITLPDNQDLCDYFGYHVDFLFPSPVYETDFYENFNYDTPTFTVRKFNFSEPDREMIQKFQEVGYSFGISGYIFRIVLSYIDEDCDLLEQPKEPEFE